MAEGYESQPIVNKVSYFGTINGNCVDRIREAPLGISYWRNANSPSNGGSAWGPYILFKHPDGGYVFLSFSTIDIRYVYNGYELPSPGDTLTWYKINIS